MINIFTFSGKVKKKLFFSFLLALLFTFLFFYFFSSIEGYIDNSIDRNNYLRKFKNHDSFFYYYEVKSYFTYFTREWLWNVGVQKIADILNDPNLLLLIVSFIIVFSAVFFVITHTHSIYLLFIVNPLFVDLAFSQLRVGLAIVVMALAYIFRKNKLFLVFFILASMSIHTSSIIFVFGGFFIFFINERHFFSEHKRKLFIVILVGLSMSFILGPLREVILSLVNDRRANYGDISSSYMYISYWLFLLSIFIYLKDKAIFDRISLFAVYILSIACFNTLFGTYSTRFLAVGLPFFAYLIYSSVISLPLRFFILLSYSCYNLLLWFYWFQSLS